VGDIVYNQLPCEIDPFRLSRQRAEFSGKILISSFDRLREILVDTQGGVDVSLKIGREEHGLVYIKGNVKAALTLACEHCGEPLTYDINVGLSLSPVLTDSQAVHLPKEVEPWVTNNQPVSVLELVEEEILLGLPMIAKHDSCEKLE
jgi:uncharacterized protein